MKINWHSLFRGFAKHEAIYDMMRIKKEVLKTK